MSIELEQAKDTIRKLLNLADNDAAAEGEIDNAFHFADRLMRAHHLSMTDVEGDPHDESAKEELWEFDAVHGWSTGRHFCSWEFSLALFVCEFLGSVKHYVASNVVKTTLHGTTEFDKHGQAVNCGQVTFYGLSDEAEMAADMFEHWRLTVAAMARMRCGGALRGKGQYYGDGFVAGMREKLRTAREQDKLTNDPTSRALVVRSNAIVIRKMAAATRWLAESKGIKLGNKQMSSRSSIDLESYRRGKADGNKADVAKPTITKGIESR